MAAGSCIICATPRSGSTLLCDLLAGTGVAGRPASYYRRQSIPHWARRLDVAAAGRTEGPEFDRRYLVAIRRQGTDDTGVFGLRLMWESLAELCARLDALFPGLPDDIARLEAAFGRSVYLHLSRGDKVAQAVSRLKAQQTGLWHVAADGSERERTMPAQAAVYDAGQLAGLVAELTEHDGAWARWFAAHRVEPLQVTYEALSADPRGVLERVLSALGHDPGRAAGAAVATARMADADSRAWADRYRTENGLSPPDRRPGT